MAAVEQHTRPARTRMPAAQRRETILRAAAEVFGEAGYRAARVSDIAARVGVTEPVVFQNFGSKPALFAATVEHAAAEGRAWLQEAAAGPRSAGQLLAHILGDPAAPGHPAARSHPTPGHPVPSRPVPGHPATGHPSDGPGDGPGVPGGGQAGGGTSAGHDATGRGLGALFADAIGLAADPALAEVSGQVLGALARHLADLVRRGQEDGSVRAGLSPDAAAWLAISLLAARPMRQAAMPPGLEAQVADLAVRLLTNHPAG
jgi:AcrR family transcriptional regulator